MSPVASVVVIMAGGAGTRFWPLSTSDYPKQFLALLSRRTLLQESYDRASRLVPAERILVLTSGSFVDIVGEQLPELPPENIIAEPMRRDTAGAVALATVVCRARFGPCTMLVLTADHRIEPVEAFVQTMQSALRAAADTGALYTCGIPPTYAAVSYGYLHVGDELLDDAGVKHHRLLGFREKPDVETASQYLSAGGYCWNSGMFAWSLDAIERELSAHIPGHFDQLRPAVDACGRVRTERLRQAFAALPSISVDYAIMEKAADVRMVAALFSWSDVGGWLAIEDLMQSDEWQNRSRGRLAVLDATHNLVFSASEDEQVALVGVHDLVVVRAGGRTLVVSRERCEDVKALVARLEEEAPGRESAERSGFAAREEPGGKGGGR